MFSCRPSGTVEFTAGQQKTVSTTAQPPAHHRWCRDLVLSHPGNPCRAVLKVFTSWDTMRAEISILCAVLPSASPELSKILTLKLQHGVGRNMTVCFAYCQESFFFTALKKKYIYSAILCSQTDSLCTCHMWFWMSDYPFIAHVINIHGSGVLIVLFDCCMAGAMWNAAISVQVLCKPFNRAPVYSVTSFKAS